MANKRIKKHKHRGMHKKMLSGKKPMSEEQKEARKKMKEKQREENKARLAQKE
jgi:hypothetical protein